MVSLPSAGSSPSIQELLAGVSFPASKEQLLAKLQQEGATELLLSAIQNLSVSQFASADAVMAALRNR
jgi:Protein of unknown function (DUF2795)